jgi:hypothetical protein
MKPGKKVTAYHEAGHAVIAHALGLTIHHATRHTEVNNQLSTTHRRTAGVTTYSALYVAQYLDAEARAAAAEHDAMVSLGGPFAQLRYRPLTPGQITRSWGDDWWHDRRETIDMVGRAVLSRRGIKPAEGTEIPIDADMVALSEHLEARTAELVEQHWPAIVRVATALLEHPVLTQGDIEELCRVRP